MVDYLAAPRATGSPEARAAGRRLRTAAFHADRAEVARILAAHPGAIDEACWEMPKAILSATKARRPDVVRLLAEIGFDVNATVATFLSALDLGGDWTALHAAAGKGDLDLARLLLSLGADPGIRDGMGATPLDRARIVGQPAMVELLTPLTTHARSG
jgi:ankyrin repeat protein